MNASTIGGINLLPDSEKFALYCQVIPAVLFEKFQIPKPGTIRISNFLKINNSHGSTDVELSLYHETGFPDPILYGHLTDTINGQIHILLYILNDPESPRFDVDRMPDGTMTKFGTLQRNIPAEKSAMEANLAPGQIRHGLRLLTPAIQSFESFVSGLGHEVFFVEPLYYHNAVIFEKYGFAYQTGKKLMDRINNGFSEGGDLFNQLNSSSVFRNPGAANSIRLRSWAIHDGILGEPFSNVTMYKKVGINSGVSTCPLIKW